ncbi:hypothetical protein [Burkholderia pseudomallei]|uniref:hypothetical protein n=1 Tax=Burkholderia pseudomallei TaxID=28450 RepID=UPI000A1A2C36|nr:hypothetical protein [Burkholderia pseudomallei]ARL38876.1 hypothetical protein BOC49_21775 [Burkholderia pseudomallei]
MNIRIPIDSEALRDRVRWCAYAAGRRLGSVGLAATAVVAAVPIAYSVHFQPETARLAEARVEARKTLAALPTPGTGQGATGLTLRDVQKLRISEQAYSVFEILEHNGIERKHATYRRDVEAKGKLRRLTIGIAASGSYAGLRAALRAIAIQPMVRIESVSLERERIDSAQLDINLRISLLGPDT